MIFWIRNLRNRIYQLYLSLVTWSFPIQLKLPNSFVDILPILCSVVAKNLPVSQKSYLSFLSGIFLNSLFFEEISEQEVINLCSSLPSGTATGVDNVTMSLIKETIGSIRSPLTRIFNLSITSGMVPVELKISRVVPLFKAGHKSIFSNCRPISVLPAFSKILEKLLYNRVIDYLSKYNILSDNQFGFRRTSFNWICFSSIIWQNFFCYQ